MFKHIKRYSYNKLYPRSFIIFDIIQRKPFLFNLIKQIINKTKFWTKKSDYFAKLSLQFLLLILKPVRDKVTVPLILE